MTELWGIADLHVHTTASDGHSTTSEVLAAARRAGLDVVAITDHDTIISAREAQRMAPAFAIEVVVGEEVSTREGHLLALFIEEWISPGRPLADTIAEVHAQGGLCIVAHPYDWLTASVGEQLRTRCGADWALDGIETFNASLPIAQMNERAARVGAAVGLAAIGGSDSHHAATVGAGYTRFPGRGSGDLRAAIRARRTIALGRPWGLRATAAWIGRKCRRDLQTLLRPSLTTALPTDHSAFIKRG